MDHKFGEIMSERFKWRRTPGPDKPAWFIGSLSKEKGAVSWSVINNEQRIGQLA